MTGALDRTVLAVGDHVRRLLRRQSTAHRSGGLQAVSPAVELLGTLVLLLVVARSRSPVALGILWAVGLSFAAVSRVPARELGRIVVPVVTLSAVVMAPQAVLVAGPTAFGPVTWPGVKAVATLVLRVTASTTFVAVLVSTVRFPALVAGLDRLGVPSTAVQLLAVTRRYLLTSAGLLAGRVRARRARRIASPSLRERWQSFGQLLAGFFLDAVRRGEAVQASARARGGPGAAPERDPAPLGPADAVFCAVVVLGAIGRWLA